MFVARAGMAALILGVMFALSGAAFAQEPAPEATAAWNAPDVDKGNLELLLKPLTKAELAESAAAWQEAVSTAGKAVAESEVSEDEALKALLSERKKARTELVERFAIVIGALGTKGGDVTEFEAYLAAVKGSALDLDLGEEGALGLVAKVKDWAISADGGIKWATKIVLFILTLIAFKIIAGIAGKVVQKAVGAMKKTSNLLRDFFVNVVKKVIFFIGLIVALSMIDVNIGPFVAAIGAVGFVIGFALQGTLANFASGIMILLYRPYDIGEVVNVAGVTGKVSAMSLVSTTLLSPDNQIVIVPNGTIWGDVITNITGSDTRRVDLIMGIGYEDDMAKAQTIIEGILDGHELILKDPAPVVKVHELADSSVNFVVRPWTKTSDYWTVYWDVTRQVKERFDEEGVSIPFPQTDVHVHNVEK